VTRNRAAIVFGIAALAVGLDQLTKYLAEEYLVLGQSVSLIGDWLSLRLAYNEAAAFSLGFGATWILALISSIAVIALIWFGPRVKSTVWAVIAGLVLGGAAGNWIDRVFKAPSFFSGHVVDFIQVPLNFPIFNFADTFLVVGVGLAILRTLRGDELGGGRVK
jgi:signal peptidase II